MSSAAFSPRAIAPNRVRRRRRLAAVALVPAFAVAVAGCYRVTESDVARGYVADAVGSIYAATFLPDASRVMVKEWTTCRQSVPCLRTALRDWDFKGDPADMADFRSGIESDAGIAVLADVLTSVRAGEGSCVARQIRRWTSTSVPTADPMTPWRAVPAGVDLCPGVPGRTTATVLTTTSGSTTSVRRTTTTGPSVPDTTGTPEYPLSVSGTVSLTRCWAPHLGDVCRQIDPSEGLVTGRSADGRVLATVHPDPAGGYTLAATPPEPVARVELTWVDNGPRVCSSADLHFMPGVGVDLTCKYFQP